MSCWADKRRKESNHSKRGKSDKPIMHLIHTCCDPITIDVHFRPRKVREICGYTYFASSLVLLSIVVCQWRGKLGTFTFFFHLLCCSLSCRIHGLRNRSSVFSQQVPFGICCWWHSWELVGWFLFLSCACCLICDLYRKGKHQTCFLFTQCLKANIYFKAKPNYIL